jgi:uncharacterized protein YndB with AHSA1/START domain
VKTLEASATSTAPPAAVWALLADASTWSQWGAWTESGVEGGGEHAPGAVRYLVKRPFRMRERVTDWVAGERMGYEVLEGMNVKGYKGTVTLEPAAGGGTLIRWSSVYEKADPVTALILKLAVRDAAKRLAKAAAA